MTWSKKISRIFQESFAPKPSALRRVTVAELITRAERSFSDIYFLGLGIFQSIIAARLFEKFFKLDVHPMLVVAQYILTAGLMVCVLFSYWWWIVLVRRRPQMRDIILPFGMGFCQFGQIEHVGIVSLWGFWVGAFCMTAVIALINSVWRLNEVRIVDGENIVSLDDMFTKVWFRPAISFTFIGAVVGLAGSLIAAHKPNFLLGWEVPERWAYLALLTAAIAGYVWWERQFLKKLHSRYAFERRLSG